MRTRAEIISAFSGEQHNSKIIAELNCLRAFVREVANQDPAQPTGQRQSNKERAEDLCEAWGITS